MHAVIDVFTQVYDHILDKKYSRLILLDIQKVFDTINQKLLIAKLDHYDIRTPAKILFKSCLRNRQRFLALDDESRIYTAYWGVPPKDQLYAHYYF